MFNFVHNFLPANLTFYDRVGLIPATDKTPDIFYSDDKSSEKVAVLTFLTLWFLDAHIQNLVKQRASSVICGVSPLSGGRRLEEAFSKANDVANITKRSDDLDSFDFSSMATRYAGRCRYAEWDNGIVSKLGYLAVYATSIDDDERNGYTMREELFSDLFNDCNKPDEDIYYRSLCDKPAEGLSVQLILAAIHSNDKDRLLAQILSDEFSDIHTLFDMVPKRVVHEVAHLLEFGSGLIPHEFIQEEAESKIPRGNAMLSHYRQGLEAVAELAGIALLKQVQINAGLRFGIPTTMLDKILPISYDYIEQQVRLMAVAQPANINDSGYHPPENI